MKIIYLTASIIYCSLSTLAFCDENVNTSAAEQAEIMLETSGTEKMMSQAVEQMLQVQLKQNPALVPYKDIMLRFINKHMSYSSLKPELIKLYSESFSAEELRDLTEFYKTPTGQKAIEKMPEIMARGAELGAMRIQGNMAELQQMIQQESERLKLLQAQ